jgi:hypothetical protein
VVLAEAFASLGAATGVKRSSTRFASARQHAADVVEFCWRSAGRATRGCVDEAVGPHRQPGGLLQRLGEAVHPDGHWAKDARPEQALSDAAA